MPTDDWPAVATMLDGFGEPSLPASAALEGPDIDIEFDNGWVIRHRFEAGQVTWTITAGDGAGATGTHPYRAVEVRAGIFFVDFVKGEGAGASDVSMIIDRADGKVTVADSSFTDRNGAIRMRTDFINGRITGAGPIEPRQPSTALVGKRIFYRYSPTEQYEHIYLNAGTFVWHCINGGEAGLADVDPIQVFELADGIVILHWSETVMPVESIVVIDLTNRRSIGRMFCWNGPTLEPVHLPFDSRFTVLNDTSYPVD
ncbi:MoaF C-terminal domain-containing protein [Mycolicibacterium cosmeticum]|uniref:MoaF C-terminal domain-containing protein n=1 Tax=Mycolicibacterium cosmeticum TaxID=258533 RepID=UPI001A9417DE|nr:MoaF C-terminal domain-containing protein [Mycolicibacterium cosmeticum]